jgi:putative transcriptional regulator
MENVPYAQIEKGAFLISTPDIEMGFFFRSVILICEHNANGSFGLVINKHLDLELPKEILSMGDLSNPHINIRAAGPLQTNQMMLLHSSAAIPQQTLKICEGVFLGGDLQFLQDALSDENGPHIFLCFGYAGWGGGQLEREFLDGNWFVCPSSAEHIFHTPPDRLWSALLRSMGGKYSALSMIPEDLSLN